MAVYDDTEDGSLREAEFFFMLMGKYFHAVQFRYLVNAFLEALYSLKEVNRLRSQDPRFQHWYRNAATPILNDADYQRLLHLRNQEIHHKGTESWQRHYMDFGAEGIQVKHSITLDFNVGSGSLGSYKMDNMEDAVEHPVETKWFWTTNGEVDVMELCSKGLVVVRALIRSRDDMTFRD